MAVFSQVMGNMGVAKLLKALTIFRLYLEVLRRTAKFKSLILLR